MVVVEIVCDIDSDRVGDSDKGIFRDKKIVLEMDEEIFIKVNVIMIDSYSKRK